MVGLGFAGLATAGMASAGGQHGNPGPQNTKTTITHTSVKVKVSGKGNVAVTGNGNTTTVKDTTTNILSNNSILSGNTFVVKISVLNGSLNGNSGINVVKLCSSS